MKNATPIKRHPGLIAFSKDHHFGLLLVWKVKKGLTSEISPHRISNYILYFFEEDLKHHFREEEELIFSKLPSNDALRKQAETEHNNIYALAEQIKRDTQDITLLRNFATQLDDHIRFEERMLFNHLQEKLEPAALEEILQQTNRQRKDCDGGWVDKFWVKSK